MATDNNTTENIQQETIQPGDLSKTLEEYRSSADLDIEQIAEALCLPPSSVKALEDEDFAKLPEPPYVRGYLRSYARLAEKDPAPVIRIYETLRGATRFDEMDKRFAVNHERHTPPSPVISPVRFRLGLLALLLLLLVLLSMVLPIGEWSQSIWNKFSGKTATVEQADVDSARNLTGNMPVSLPPPVSSGNNNSENAAGSTLIAQTEQMATDDAMTDTATDTDAVAADAGAEESAANDSQQQTAETTPAEDSGNSAEPVTAPEQQPQEAQPGDTAIKMVFSDEVWLRIQDNKGNRLYEALNQAGNEKEITLTKPMKFKVGNAQGLKLFVNGEEIDITKYIKGSIANFSID